ncbi:hypothetical protein K490DRAFT_63988 [Saccharata proteae CBS 121410]|uniref:Mediator of RNA polymerase II transcription subunit 16 n=1 Tax=Saccharata proteae CBS 121410 TaxID=1314787 RepID=A0A6A5YA89_9PEZI|nr:hypothetical protein K490DRAFT_63988 [Saccharata proteae CBS 121410]
MDDDQYMEDLFNDSEPINIPPPGPSVKGLAQRLDELEETGCCQKIAWSRSGCVATITRDGRGVNLRAFQRNPADGKWILGEESPLQIPPVHDEFPLVHVSWGHLGVDLAILDAAGRVLIFTNNFALDRMHMTRDNVMDQEVETGTIVGLHWLPVFPQQAKYRMLWSATRKNENDWHYGLTGHQMKGPHNPIEPRAAIICLTRNGTIRLLHQQADSQWHDAVSDVEAINSAKATFTHASFAPDKDDALLLAAHDLSGSLHIYRIRIHWNLTKQQPGQLAMTSPVLEVSALKTEDNCSPTGSSLDVTDGAMDNEQQQVSFPAQLTHLTFVPTAPHEASSPMILAVFSHTPAAIPSLVGQSSTQQPPFSILARWELTESKAGLHSGLNQLSAKKKTTGNVEARRKLSLKRLPDIIQSSVTLSFYNLDYNTIFCLCQSDGRIEFRRRDTMEIMTADYNSDKVSSLIQAGFVFPSSEPALHVALSPSFCVAAMLQSDSTIALKSMEYSHGSLTTPTPTPDPKATAAVVAITLQHSSASLQYCSTDDLLSILPTSTDATLKETFLSGTYNSMNIATDFTAEENAQTLMKQIFNNNLARGCLSAQSLLGTTAPGQQDLPGKLAWATLNLRLTTLAIAMSMQTKPESFKPETAKSLTGLVKYTMDTTVYIIDELIELSHALKDHLSTRTASGSILPFITAHIIKHSSPALLLLLSSYPRSLLRITHRPFSYLFTLTKSILPHAPSVQARAHYNGLLATFIASPVQPPHLVQLINDVDAAVRGAYEKAGWGGDERRRAEREMLVSGRVPGVLEGVVGRLLGVDTSGSGEEGGGNSGQGVGGLQKVCEAQQGVNVAGVMFMDLRWLGLREGRRERAWWDEHTVDVLRKVVLRNGSKTGAGAVEGREGGIASAPSSGRATSSAVAPRRRCARCASVMEDKEGRGEAWLGSFHKACACGSSWVLEGRRG